MEMDLGPANGFYSPGANLTHAYFNAVTGEDQGNNTEVIVGTSGDDVLIEVRNILLQHTRPTDMVARLGGDEFACWPELLSKARRV